MHLTTPIGSIYEMLLQFVPFLRASKKGKNSILLLCVFIAKLIMEGDQNKTISFQPDHSEDDNI